MQETRRLISILFLSSVMGCGFAAPGGDDGPQPLPIPLLQTLLGPPGDLDAQLAGALLRAGVTNPVPAPGDASNAQLVELGRALFFDPILSGDRNVSCATCHHPAAGTSDALPVSIGAGGSGSRDARSLASGVMIARNAPALYNLGGARADRLFWDGRVRRDAATGELTTPEAGLNGPSPSLAAIAAQLQTALAAQALFPVTSDTEMRGNPGNDVRDAVGNEAIWAALMARLVGTANGTVGGIAGYRTLFATAFPEVASFDDLNFGHAGRAIAAYEMASFRSPADAAARSPFARYLAGEPAALSERQKRGALTFFGPRGGCARCHRGPELSDFRFHSIAAPQLGPGVAGGDDLGLAQFTGDSADSYRFRTPALWNVALSGPWTHSGAYSSLEAMVRHYVDPVGALQNYDAGQVARAEFRATVDSDPNRIAARAASLDGRLRTGARLSPRDVQDVVSFLQALTDSAASNASQPSATVSGLDFAH